MVYDKATCTMFGEEQRGVRCHLGGKTSSKNHVTLVRPKKYLKLHAHVYIILIEQKKWSRKHDIISFLEEK